MRRSLGAAAVLGALLATLLVSPPAPADAAPIRRSDAANQVDAARAAYEDARARVAALSSQAEQLTANADAAEAEADRLRAQLGDDGGGVISALRDFVSPGPSDLDRAAEAASNAEDARRLADMVQQALDAQIAAAEDARAAWERAERRQAKAEAAWTAQQYADAAIARAHFLPTYDAVGAQDRRNQRALRDWHDYLEGLARAGVVPPRVADLSDPSRLPDGLDAVRDQHNDLSPGVARTHDTTVISAEAVDAVTEALRRVGLPDVPGDVDPQAYACGGLVANAWSTPTLAPPADAPGQWQELRTVPTSSAQPGDVVVLGTRRGGLTGTAVYLGGGRAVVVDAGTGVAAVRPLGDGDLAVLGVRRAGIGTGQHAAAPAGGTCGTPTATATATGNGPFVLPVAEGSYHLTSGFGDAGSHWSSGSHTGLDFAAPTGTPAMAVGAGTVTIEHPGWAGNLVRIDHGGGVETLYAHLSRVDVTDGETVTAGQQVGLVGEEGNTTGPHLHLEVRLDGTPYDPALVLDVPELPRATYPNGEMPDDALCPATPDGVQRLRCDAAVSFRLLSASYEDALGTPLCITDSYRSRAGQVSAHLMKPNLTAVPGTSVHGLGLAVDLCGGVERFDSTENDWLLAHGPAFGWVHPSWAAPGGGRPEPWHFEYTADGA